MMTAGVPAMCEYTVEELLTMTVESLSYDVEADTASAQGVGRIDPDSSMGIVFARRAAITDAQRGLLILRRALREGRSPRPESVSGNLPPFRVISEDVKEGLYFVKIETDLSKLMKGKDTRRVMSGILDDEEEDIP